MKLLLIFPFFKAREKRIKEQQRETFKMMKRFKDETSYITGLIMNSMANPETFMKCRDTTRTMLMNYRRRWLGSFSDINTASLKANEKTVLVDSFERFIIMLNDLINEGFISREVSNDVLMEHKLELIKVYVRTFEDGLPKPIKMPDAGLDERYSMFNDKFNEGVIFSFEQSQRPTIDSFSGQLCKVIAASKEDDSWGNFTFETNGKQTVVHIDDLSGVRIHWQLSHIL